MGKDDQYNNPNGYNPPPNVSGLPQTLWITEVMPVAWVGVVNTSDTAFWKSPTFDLRPDLRSAQSMVKAGVPIWSGSARMRVQLFGLAVPGVLDSLRLEYREFGNTTWGQVTQAAPNRAVANSGAPNQIGRDPIVQIMPRVDITSEMMLGIDQPPSAFIDFVPAGDGYPIRYWAVELLWSTIESVTGPTGLSFQAAMS